MISHHIDQRHVYLVWNVNILHRLRDDGNKFTLRWIDRPCPLDPPAFLLILYLVFSVLVHRLKVAPENKILPPFNLAT